MSTELMSFDYGQVPALSTAEQAAFEDLSRGSGFLRRLQLVSSGKYVSKKLVQPGSWAIPIDRDHATDLGEKIDVVFLSTRVKAIDMSDSPPLTVFDVNDPEFARIRALSESKKSNCQSGNEFLVYERSTKELYTLFFGNASARPVSRTAVPFLPLGQAQIDNLVKLGKVAEGELTAHGPLAATLSARLCEGKDKKTGQTFTWFVPEVKKCSLQIVLPDLERVVYPEIAKFRNPPARVQEEQEEDTEAGKGRRAR